MNFAMLRQEMVSHQLEGRDITDSRVLGAIASLPREEFLPPNERLQAYDDRALPIGCGQTISQPYIVAFMTQALRVEPFHDVLEIGTGSGYQTALLARLVHHVFTVERIGSLSQQAQQLLARLDLKNVSFRVDDGSVGWSDHAPYDRIMVTAAAPKSLPGLTSQLKEGGRMISPIGEDDSQQLSLFERRGACIIEKPLLAVRFVRLIGKAGYAE